MGCETCCLTVRGEYRLSVIKNRILRKIFRCEGGSQRRLRKVVGWRASFVFLANVMLVKSKRMRCAKYVAWWEKTEMCTWFWWRNLKVQDHFENLCTERRIILKWSYRHKRADAIRINFSHDKDPQRNLVNTIMNILVQQTWKIWLLKKKFLHRISSVSF